jgi:hypothetical protein
VIALNARQASSAEESPKQGAGDMLIDSIAEAVVRKMERLMGTQQRLLEIEDAAKYLGMTAHALRHKAVTQVPVVRVDNKLRFDRRDLDRYIDHAKREGV